MTMEPARAAARNGQGRLVVSAVAGRSVVVAAEATSPLRWVMPSFPGARAATACMVTFGGGLVDGDRIDVDVVVEAGAVLVIVTQASTKVFRGGASQRLRARVDGTLVLLPDPVAAFAGARYRQRVDVALGPAGSCVLLDGFTSGRPAFGERWAMQALDLETRVTLQDRPVVVDALALDAADARAGRFEAFATLLAVGQGAASIVRDVGGPVAPPLPDLAVAASPLPRAADRGIPGAIARIAATSPARALAAVRARLRNLPDIGAVDPWSSRHGDEQRTDKSKHAPDAT